MNQFIKIGEKIFPAEDVCKLLGVDPKSETRIALGEVLPGGTLEASVSLGNPSDYPNINTSYCPDGGAAMLLSTSEMNLGEEEDGESKVRTFLYDRAESYVGYITHDIRPEEELGDEKLRSRLIASGDMDVTVDIYRENKFANYCGDLL